LRCRFSARNRFHTTPSGQRDSGCVLRSRSSIRPPRCCAGASGNRRGFTLRRRNPTRSREGALRTVVLIGVGADRTVSPFADRASAGTRACAQARGAEMAAATARFRGEDRLFRGRRSCKRLDNGCGSVRCAPGGRSGGHRGGPDRASAEAVERVSAETDDVVVFAIPQMLSAIGEWHDPFERLSGSEVSRFLLSHSESSSAENN